MKVQSARPWSVGVVIPARNEAATIGRCVESIIAAHENCGRPARLWIVVAADACDDLTATVARAALGSFGEVIECESRSSGTARRLGASAVMQHFRDASSPTIWLANTDADSHVPSDWLKLHLDHADDGATAVAGIVTLDSQGARTDVLRLHRETYELRSDGSHGHVHGANLGVRADAYLDAGGWSHLRVAEDHCLWRRLRLRGWRLRSCVKSAVITSARLHGRAVGGFADALRRRVEPEHG